LYSLIPHSTQTIFFKDGKLKFDIFDLFRLSLYLDLKSDLVTRDKAFGKTQSLLAILNSNVALFCTELNASMVFYALLRYRRLFFLVSGGWMTVFSVPYFCVPFFILHGVKRAHGFLCFV
jgi:hypothetical protein